MGGVKAGSGKEDEPQIVECANVHRKETMGEKCEENVASPDHTERELTS